MCLASQGNRVVLSGIGGDETIGGFQIQHRNYKIFSPEHDLGCLHQPKSGLCKNENPGSTCSWRSSGCPSHSRWCSQTEPTRTMAPIDFYEWTPGSAKRLSTTNKAVRYSAEFQDDVSTLTGLQRLLSSKSLPLGVPYDQSYPYLDRKLLEFMYAIPREQSVRPTQRRSLLRRALAGIVPGEILNRNRKAFVARAPLVSISSDWTNLVEMTQHMISGSLGLVGSEPPVSCIAEVPAW